MSGIRALRERDGISVEELAERFGLPVEAIKDWESGESSPNSIQVATLARLFRVSKSAITEPTAIVAAPPPTESLRPEE